MVAQDEVLVVAHVYYGVVGFGGVAGVVPFESIQGELRVNWK